LIKIIDETLLKNTTERARQSPRSRMNFNLHELADPVQRMLNAIEPGSYIRPHRHLETGKTELFTLLKGRGTVITFDNEGNINDIVQMEAGGEILGVEIPPAVWHTVISLEKGTVFLEIKDGPYVAATDKDFAKWSPEAGSKGEKEYLKNLVEKIAPHG